MDSVKRAREVFEQYAAMGAGELPSNPGSALQVRLRRWEVRNFSYQPPYRHALGLAEELGELVMAESSGERLDAIGDIAVFAMQLATDWRLDFWSLSHPGSHQLDLHKVTIAIGRIAHGTLKHEQRIRGFEDTDYAREWIGHHLAMLKPALGGMCICDGHELFEVASVTAEHVMRRDWTKKEVA